MDIIETPLPSLGTAARVIQRRQIKNNDGIRATSSAVSYAKGWDHNDDKLTWALTIGSSFDDLLFFFSAVQPYNLQASGTPFIGLLYYGRMIYLKRRRFPYRLVLFGMDDKSQRRG